MNTDDKRTTVADGCADATSKSVMFWAPLPPPIGGVTRSATELIDWLKAKDRFHGVADVGQPKSLPAAIWRHRKAPVHLFWCSTPEAVAKHSVIARLVQGQKWIYVHGGQAEHNYRSARLLSRGQYDRVFVTNTDLIELLGDWKLGAAAEVASPFAPINAATPRRVPTRDQQLIVAIGGYRSWYGLDIALEAYDQIKSARPDASPTLTVVMYGTIDGPRPTDHLLDSRSDVRVEHDLDPDEMLTLMTKHDTLLRPSTVDGDALIIREALHAGLRVIASDVVPRPSGTEICPNTSSAFADAIMSGGILSTGDGLGPAFTELL
jgi:glycosyltransferase involved in cell wall biosynthesis